MEESDSHAEKALSPIEDNDLDNRTDLRFLHSEKASGPIERTESGISTEIREEHD